MTEDAERGQRLGKEMRQGTEGSKETDRVAKKESVDEIDIEDVVVMDKTNEGLQDSKGSKVVGLTGKKEAWEIGEWKLGCGKRGKR